MKRFFGSSGKRVATAAALVSAAVLALGACGNSSAGTDDVKSGPPVDASDSAWKSIVEKAKKEGALTLYWSSGEREASPRLFDEFEKAYPGIKVKIVFLATGDLVNRIDQEIAGKVRSADVINHANPGWFVDNYKANNFAALQVSPENEAAGWDDMLDGKSYATWWGFQYLLGYSTKQPKPEPDLKAILDANPHVKIGIVDPHASSASANVYETLRTTYGDQILDQLSKADYTVYESNSQLSAGFAAGAVDYAYPDQVNTTGPLIKKGAQVAQLVTTKAGAGANYNVAVLKTAPHPNAAQVWANFAMSKAGQEAIVQDNAPAASVPTSVTDAIPWGSVNFLDPDKWTTDDWNAWIAKYWTPRFE